MTTKILKCKCLHGFQDKEYGDGNRVHNQTAAKEPSKFRCTVCGDVKVA